LAAGFFATVFEAFFFAVFFLALFLAFPPAAVFLAGFEGVAGFFFADFCFVFVRRAFFALLFLLVLEEEEDEPEVADVRFFFVVFLAEAAFLAFLEDFTTLRFRVVFLVAIDLHPPLEPRDRIGRPYGIPQASQSIKKCCFPSPRRAHTAAGCRRSGSALGLTSAPSRAARSPSAEGTDP
jgi:hypothetical protein